MKKEFKFLASLCTIMMAAAISVSAAATVKTIEGRVELQDGSVWVALEVGDELEKGAVISTGFKSSATIELNKSTITLGPLTRITLEELIAQENQDITQLYIDSGTISASVNNEDGKRTGFKVRSPVATASVRGTAFTATASGSVNVTNGLVSFSPAEPRNGGNTTVAHDTSAKSSVFTNSDNVGEASGVPVYAGQSSKTNSLTGLQSSPKTESINATKVNATNTTSALAKEAVSTSESTVTASISSAVSAPKTAKIVVGFDWD